MMIPANTHPKRFLQLFSRFPKLRAPPKSLMIGPTMDVSSFLRGLPGGQALNSAKDRLIASGARARLNKLIERYGTLLDLQLNTMDRSLSLTLHLKGEQTPVEIHLHEYTLSNVDGKSVLIFDGRKIETSREWLTTLIRDRVGENRLAVPENLEWVAQLLR
jgi:hypothetical protein